MQKHKPDDEDGRHSARAYAREPPEDGPYEDPIDREARQADSIDDRIRVIALLLSQGRWSKLKALQYANLWAVSPRTIRDYSTQANRLRKEVVGAAGMKRLQSDLEAQYRAAFELAIGQGDPKAAVMATKALAELRGANAPKGDKGGTSPASNAPPLPPEVQALLASPEAMAFLANLQVSKKDKA